MTSIRITICLTTLGYGCYTFGQDREEFNKNADAATSKTKQMYHITFREKIDSANQQDWTGKYDAHVEVLKDGNSLYKCKGSTLPNDQPPKEDPNYKYSIVASTGYLKSKLNEVRYYTWEKGVRANRREPCLRLAAKVPTVNVGTARRIDKVASLIINGAEQGDFQYATEILIHSGFKTNWRGSAGCLTIEPDKATEFFGKIPDGTKGTLEILRGIEDKLKMISYDY